MDQTDVIDLLYIRLQNNEARLVASGPAWLTCERGITKLKTQTKLFNGTKIDGMRWAWEGHLRGGGQEVRDVLLSGAVVGVAVCDMSKKKMDQTTCWTCLRSLQSSSKGYMHRLDNA
jgi:hypothetical protein